MAEIHLTVNPTYHIYDTVNLYEYEGAYTFENQIISENGDYKAEYYTINGCDSVICLHAYTKDMNDTIILTDDGKYNIDDEGGVTLDSCNGTGDVIIPATVTDSNGNEYPVTSIGDGAFKDNDSITSVTIPETVTEIGCEAFLDCDNLDTVIMLPTVPPAICETALPPANGKGEAPTIKVPCGSGDAYKNAPVWKNYEIVEDCNGLEDINGATRIRIYPNPAKNKVTIQGASGNVTIIDNSGKVVKMIEFADTAKGTKQISISDLESGVYYIKIGEITKKLIVKQ